MLDRIQTRAQAPFDRADKLAVLRALADVLPIDGIIMDDDGQSYRSSVQCDYDRGGNQRHLHAEILPMRSNTALVKLRQIPCAKHAARQNTHTYLFVLAKSENEWEMMGQPLPFGHSSIPA